MAEELTDADVMQPAAPPTQPELSDAEVMQPAAKVSSYETFTQKFAPIAASGAEAFKSAFEGSDEKFQKYQDYLAQNPLFGNRIVRQGAEAFGAALSLTTKTLQGVLYGAGAMAGATYQAAGGSETEANKLTRDLIIAAQVAAPELREMPVSTEVTKAATPALREFQSTVIDPGIAKTAEEIVAKPVAATVEGQPAPHPLQALYDHLNTMDEAKQLGVIGDEAPKAETLGTRSSPALQAQQDIPPRAMAAARAPDDKITMTPTGEPIDAYQQRFEEWVGKIEAPSDVRDLIDRAAQENDYFPAARDGEVPAAHVEKVAEAAGLDPTTIDRAGLSTRFTRPAEIRAVEQSLLQTTSDFRDAAAKMDADPSPENAAAMMEARVRRDYTLEYTLGLRSEWGRAGQALKDILDVSKREQTVTDLLREKGESMDDLREIARGMRNLSPEQSARAMSGMRGKHPPGWFYWSWQQGLLSGLITHAGYAATNVGYILAQRILAPALSSVVGAIRGGERTFFGEAMVAPLGVIRSFPDAFRSAYQAAASNMRVPMKEELTLAARGAEPAKSGTARPYEVAMMPDWGMWKSMADWLGVQPATRGAVETAAAIGLGWPGRMANALHTFTKVMSKQAFMDSAAYHAAAKEGLSPLTGDFWNRYSQHLANPTDDVLRAGVDAAYSGSFMQKLGPVTGNISQALGKSPLRWILPFRHVPFNLARATFEWSPLAFAGPEMRANLLGRNGAEIQNLAMSKVFAGSTLIGYFAMKYLNGQATGDYPVDPKERRDWQLQGKQPNSILSNGEWISLQRFGPPGRLANLGANIGSIVQGFAKGAGDLDHQVAEAIGKTIIAAAEFVGSDVGFLFLHNMIDAMEDPRHAASFAANQASSYIPWSTMLGQNASFMDPDMRKLEGIVAGIKYRIPGLRETLPPKRDPLYGDPVPNPGYHAVFREAPVRADFAKLEMQRLDYHPGAPPNKVGNVKLTPQLYDEYQATAGPLVKQLLDNYTRSPGYANVPDAQKARDLRGLVALGRSQARQAMLAHHQEIIQEGLDARKTAIFGKP